MNKSAIIKKIVARLVAELEVYARAASAAHAEATHEQSKPENKYDTRGLEASYLARGQSRQAIEIESAIAAFQRIEVRTFAPDEPIDVGALVELDGDGERTLYFVGPKAGGTEVQYDKRDVLVITPQSPLGAQLQGKKMGQRVVLDIGNGTIQYQVAKVE